MVFVHVVAEHHDPVAAAQVGHQVARPLQRLVRRRELPGRDLLGGGGVHGVDLGQRAGHGRVAVVGRRRLCGRNAPRCRPRPGAPAPWPVRTPPAPCCWYGTARHGRARRRPAWRRSAHRPPDWQGRPPGWRPGPRRQARCDRGSCVVHESVSHDLAIYTLEGNDADQTAATCPPRPPGWGASAAGTMPDLSRRFPAMTDTPSRPDAAAPESVPATAQPSSPEPAAPEPTVPVPAALAEGLSLAVAATSAEAAAPAAAAPPAVAELSPAACAARLAELFPALFGAGRALPIKLRVQADIQQRAPGVFTRKSLSPFLHRYTTSTAYLKALVNSPHRFDLDGAPAGEIDDVHRQAAATELERRRGLFEARACAERAAANEARRAGRGRRAAAACCRGPGPPRPCRAAARLRIEHADAGQFLRPQGHRRGRSRRPAPPGLAGARATSAGDAGPAAERSGHARAARRCAPGARALAPRGRGPGGGAARPAAPRGTSGPKPARSRPAGAAAGCGAPASAPPSPAAPAAARRRRHRRC